MVVKLLEINCELCYNKRKIPNTGKGETKWIV